MEILGFIIGMITLLAFAAGTIAVISTCFNWINDHFISQDKYVHITIKTAFFLFFGWLSLMTIFEPKRENSDPFTKKLFYTYFLIISFFGLFTVVRDYYKYFKDRKSTHRDS